MMLYISMYSDTFQSAPLREGRQLGDRKMITDIMFQSAPLREGRPRFDPHGGGVSMFQSAPLREGRRGWAWQALDRGVSIRAPA